MSTTTYRIEVSPNRRAGCQATHCKNDNVKIEKGEIRQGVYVTIGEFQSWKWRHWGCVTPVVIHNWKEASGGDFDYVDGFDALPEDIQNKVRRAFEQGHVDDEDWNGDVEMNRYTGAKSQGMFKKTPKKKAEALQDGDDGDEAAAKKSAKKRGRGHAEAEDGPTPKKRRGKTAAKEEGNEDAAEPPAKKSRKSKVKEDEADEQPAQPVEKEPGRRETKAATTAEAAEEDDGSAPKKRAASRKSKRAAPAVDSDEAAAADDAEGEVKPKAQRAKGRGRPKKASASD